MEAPEKIYLYPSDRAGYEYEEEWGNKPWGENYVEYTRSDAFIEKACEWFRDNYEDIGLEWLRGYNANDVIEDFKKYIED